MNKDWGHGYIRYNDGGCRSGWDSDRSDDGMDATGREVTICWAAGFSVVRRGLDKSSSGEVSSRSLY